MQKYHESLHPETRQDTIIFYIVSFIRILSLLFVESGLRVEIGLPLLTYISE